MTEEVQLNPQERYEALLAEFESARRNRDVDIDALRVLAQDVTAAKAAAQSYKTEQTRAAREQLVETFTNDVRPFFATMSWADVSIESVNVKYVVADGTLTVTPSVPGVTKTRAKGESSGGSRSRKSYTLNGTSYTSRELVETFGPEINAERTATVLTDSAKGLSHFADEIAKKKGAEVSTG